MKRLSLFLIIMYCVTHLGAKSYTISGYLNDKNSGETLIGATIFDFISGKGAVANVHGFYSLTVPEGDVRLEVSYVSYEPRKVSFELTRDTVLNIELSSLSLLEEVTVVANKNDFGVRGSQMSAIEVPIAQIKNIPALGGEVDVIKALQLLPGVQSGSEGAVGLYVRGGGPDQNLILLDGVPLYNVNHLFGFFSVFNADAVKNVTLYKGNFPARFGSRLSSVVDVRQNEGDSKAYHGSVTVGLLSAKVNFEGPIIKDKTTFNISARRTYFDILAQPFIAIMSKRDDNSSSSGGYYFYDVNAKVTHKFSDKNKLSASFYMGDDAVSVSNGAKLKKDGEVVESSDMNMRWDWGNLLGSANWAHQFSNNLFSNMVVSYTRYKYKINMKNEMFKNMQKDAFDMDYRSDIQDVSFLYDFDYTPHPNHVIKFGANYVFHTFMPEVSTMKIESTLEITGQDTTVQTNTGGNHIYTHEAAVYFEDNWNISRVFKLNMGLRGSLYAIAGGKIYPSIEPRMGLRALITKNLSLKGSYSYMSQYIHLLSSSNITMPTDLWVPVTNKIKPMLSHQVAVGVYYNLLGELDCSVEGYYKEMTNVLEYKDGASFFGNSEGWEDKVSIGDGWSYGVELLVQRSVGKFTGWVGYTWSKTMRQFDREGMEINNGEPFYAKYDRRHDVSVVAQYKLNDRIDFAATFVYGTGTRATLGSQVYYDISLDFEHGGQPPLLEHIPERYNYKLPDYMRIDFGVNFRKPLKKIKGGESIWNVSVYNLTSRNNPFIVVPELGRLKQISIFPILPSVSYTFKF